MAMDNKASKGGYNEREAADYAGVCSRSIFQARKDGQLQAVRFGKRVIYRREDLDRWLKSLESDTEATRAAVKPASAGARKAART